MNNNYFDVWLEEDDSIVRIVGEGGRTLFQMQKALLPATTENQCSAWILHLLFKTWSNREILYALAKRIKKLFPQNVIDWFKTFHAIEKAFKGREWMETAAHSSIVDGAYGLIHYSRQEENFNGLDEEVKAKLTQLNLV